MKPSKHKVAPKVQNNKVIKKGNTRPTTTGTKKREFKVPFKMPYALLFVCLWFFSTVIYGGVFYMAEQNIYFAFDKTIMQNVLYMNDAYIQLLGRFCLLSFHYPVWGGVLLAAILTLIAWLIDYLFKFKGWMRSISIALPIIYLAYVVYKGLNLFYQHEPSFLFAYPVLLLVVLLLATAVVRFVTKRPIHSIWKVGKEDTDKSCLINYLVLLLLYAGLLVFAVPFRENTRAIVKMQRLMEEENWDEMIETALKLDCPSRPVACFYAIALSQTGQISTRLFDLHYQYPNLHLKNRAGQHDASSEYYAADGDFYAGLINTSYHDCMERSVIDGPSIQRLKRMYLCALMNEERFLAHKYLNLIAKMPFENAFIEKYGPMLYDTKLMKADMNLAKVAEVMPVEDSFEQWYRAPLFIGYNTLLTAGRSMHALQNSLAACLYAKDLNSFFERMSPLSGQTVPKSFEEGLVLYGLKDVTKIKNYQVSPFSLQTAKTFLVDAVEYKGQDRKEVYYKLKDQYAGFYPCYYYFENVPDENYFTHKKEAGRVN